MPTIRTGPVRVSGYAIKLRRVMNAILKEYYSKGELDSKKVNETVSDMNRKIYSALVERFEIPKEAIVNVIVECDVESGELKIRDVAVDVYDRNEILSRNVTSEVRKSLGIG